MQIRWLGWAGVEIEAQGELVVLDPLQNAAAVFAWIGDLIDLKSLTCERAVYELSKPWHRGPR